MASDSQGALRTIKRAFPKGVVKSADDFFAHPRPSAPSTCYNRLAYDLWQLSSTRLIIGSPSSTFGMLAAGLGAPTPLAFPVGCDGKLSASHEPGAMEEEGASHLDALAQFSSRVFCTNSPEYHAPTTHPSCQQHQKQRGGHGHGSGGGHAGRRLKGRSRT